MSISARDAGATAERIATLARRNPEGVLLLAAGVALLMRGAGAAAGALRPSPEPARTKGRKAARTSTGATQAAPEEDEDDSVFSAARTQASELAGQARQAAEDMADYATEAGRAAFERSGRAVRDASTSVRTTMDRMIEEQPLSLAFLGLAAGAMAASVLPASAPERRVMRPVGRSIAGAAKDARRRVDRSVSRVKQRASEMAQERGLDAEGLKSAAQDLAGAFSEELLEGGGRSEAPPRRRAAASEAKKADRPSALTRGTEPADRRQDMASGESPVPAPGTANAAEGTPDVG